MPRDKSRRMPVPGTHNQVHAAGMHPSKTRVAAQNAGRQNVTVTLKRAMRGAITESGISQVAPFVVY